MNIKRTPVPLQHQRGGDIKDVLRGPAIFIVCMSVFLVNPLAATLCSPMFSSFSTGSHCSISWFICHGVEHVAQAQDSPLRPCQATHHRDFPLFDAVMDSRGCAFPSSPITVSARTCQQWQVPHWSWILLTRRVDQQKNNLRVVWRGSQRVNYLCVYVCVYVYMYVCVYLCV